MKVVEGRIKLKRKLDAAQRIPVRYIIKEDVGKVIAIANIPKDLFMDIVETKNAMITPWASPKKLVSRIFMNETYKAVATLDPEDTWNERVGMRVAGKKLKNKLNDAMDRRAKFLGNYLRKVADNL